MTDQDAMRRILELTNATTALGTGPIVELVHDGRWNVRVGLSQAFDEGLGRAVKKALTLYTAEKQGAA